MNYNKKYLNYKNKYINLKKNQKGGAPIDMEFIGITESEFPYKLSKTTHEIKKELHLVKIVLDEENIDKPVLFVLAGMSHNSFLGTSKIILSKLDELKKKFKEVYLLEYASYQDDQKSACGYRDLLFKQREDDEKLYEPEYIMNYNIANNIHEIIQDLKLENVYLLGKCNGAWVVSLLLLKDERYKALYLAVPGIPTINGIPSIYDILSRLNESRKNEVKFVFGWVLQDAFPFHWGMLSFEEKNRYDEIMKILYNVNNLDEIPNYKSFIYDNGEESNPKIYHELYPDLIDEIVK